MKEKSIHVCGDCLAQFHSAERLGDHVCGPPRYFDVKFKDMFDQVIFDRTLKTDSYVDACELARYLMSTDQVELEVMGMMVHSNVRSFALRGKRKE